MSTEIIVRLKITSSRHTPEFISDVIGIPSEQCWRVGDLRPNTTIEEKVNVWILGSGLNKLSSIEDQLIALLLRIEPGRSRLIKVLEGDEIEVSCVVYSESPPALNFGNEIIAGISSLGASLDIDLYV